MVGQDHQSPSPSAVDQTVRQSEGIGRRDPANIERLRDYRERGEERNFSLSSSFPFPSSSTKAPTSSPPTSPPTSETYLTTKLATTKLHQASQAARGRIPNTKTLQPPSSSREFLLKNCRFFSTPPSSRQSGRGVRKASSGEGGKGFPSLQAKVNLL